MKKKPKRRRELNEVASRVANNECPHAAGGEEEIEAAIAGAEEVRDPLGSLVERTKTDPGAPFLPDVRERLAALKKTDLAAFERLRAQLKGIDCRVTELDKAIDGDAGDGGTLDLKQADVLIGLAREADLFHAPDGTSYADLQIDGHRETVPIRGKGFRHWLTRQYYQADGAPSSEAMQAALYVIDAKAQIEGPQRLVHLRVGGLDGRLYLDLGDKSWRAVEIDADGWRVVQNPPVRFRRAAGMQPLPEPVRGGSIDALREFLNVAFEADFVLAVGWLFAVLREHGPYPVLVLTGEQGSAKSTFTRIMRGLVDPNTAALRSLPRSDRDLFIAANNGYVIAFDNVSGLPVWLSDTLCRLATGGGFATRQLYTDQDEVLFDSTRPSIANGIEDFVTRPDLADRALLLTLKPIAEQDRRSEKELWTKFEAKRPLILGALLDAVVHGIGQLPHLSHCLDLFCPAIPAYSNSISKIAEYAQINRCYGISATALKRKARDSARYERSRRNPAICFEVILVSRFGKRGLE